MTPKELMRLALEAGFDVRPGRDGPWDIWATENSFNRLAELLASDCPDCEYHKQRAALWRHEAYRLGGTPLPWDADEAIAKAVAAERERIKQANAPEIERINAYIKAIEGAVAAEREACAKVCENEHKQRELYFEQTGNGMPTVGLLVSAAAIRARGAK